MKYTGIPLCEEWGCVLTHLSRQRTATPEAVSGVELAYRTIELDTPALTWIPLRTFEKANVNCLASSRVFTSSRSYSHKKDTDNVFRYNSMITDKQDFVHMHYYSNAAHMQYLRSCLLVRVSLELKVWELVDEASFEDLSLCWCQHNL